MMKRIVLLLLCGVCSASAEWYTEVGPWYRGDMSVGVRGGSRAAEMGALAARPGTRGGMPNALSQILQDDGTAAILREFNDGFVGPSGWAWANADGITQFWGYENESQYDSEFSTLNFTKDATAQTITSRSVTRLTSGPAGWQDERTVSGAGLQGTLGYVLGRRDTFDVSLQGTLGWLDGIDARFNDRVAYRQSVETRSYQSTLSQMETWLYTYDTLGNPAFPAAPYEMTDPEAIAPMIADTPDSIERVNASSSLVDTLTGVRRQSATSRVTLNVESSLLVLNIGPRLRWQPNGSFALFVQPGVTLNYLDANARRSEVFTLDNGTVLGVWNDRKDEQTWLWGAGVAGGVQWQATERFYVVLAGGYDHVETHAFNVGPDRVRMDVSGYNASLAVGFLLGGN